MPEGKKSMTRRGTEVTEAGIRDVAKRILHNVRDWEIAKRLVEKVKKYWDTHNERDDLTLDESHAIYQREDYGDSLPLTKKRHVDIGWSDHAEYRSDLRDVPHTEINQSITDWLRDRLMTKGPDKKKVRMKLPGKGTAVVDYDLTRNPADADIITVWASDSRTAGDQDEVLETLKMDFPFHSVQEKADRLYDKYGSGGFKGDEPVPEELLRHLKPLNRIWFAFFRVIKAAYQQDRRLKGVYESALEAEETFRLIRVNEDWRSEFVNLLARIKNTHTGLYAIKTASTKTAGSVMTEDEYIMSKGLDAFPPGEPGLHRTPRRPPKSQQRQNDKMMLKRQDDWQKKVDALREEYRQKVMDGEIRPPSRIERLLDTAKGHPDNPSVQAARRILRKQGLWDDQMEESDARFAASSRTAVNYGPPTLAALVDKMSSRVRLSSSQRETAYEEMADRISEDVLAFQKQKHRMPTDRNLGTRVHPDKKKFQKTQRQKEKQKLRREDSE